jgi:hypothetical protein
MLLRARVVPTELVRRGWLRAVRTPITKRELVSRRRDQLRQRAKHPLRLADAAVELSHLSQELTFLGDPTLNRAGALQELTVRRRLGR